MGRSNPQASNQVREITVTGTLFPARFDKKGNVTGLVIDTPDQDNYLIENKGMGTELMHFIGADVEVTGTLKENERGDFYIRIKKYRILSNAQEKVKKANSP